VTARLKWDSPESGRTILAAFTGWRVHECNGYEIAWQTTPEGRMANAGDGGEFISGVAEATCDVERDPVTRPSQRTQKALAADKAARERRAFRAGVVCLVFVLGLILMAAVFSGCATVSDKSIDGAAKALAAIEADLRDWQKLSDDQKKRAHWEVGRALGDVVGSAGGSVPAIFATNPYDRSSAPSLPSDAGR